MKTKTKTKQVKDLSYPCYFTIAYPRFKEGINPVDAIESENQSFLINNPYFREIQERNNEVIEELMVKTDFEVTDDTFFDLLRYTPIILGSHFAQVKIVRWQNEMQNGGKDIASEAQLKLKKIGYELARKALVSPGLIFKVAFFRDFLKEFIDGSIDVREEFMQSFEEATGIEIRNDHEIASLYIDIDYDRKNIPKLINLIIAKIMGLTEGTVRQYLKKVTDVYDNGQKIGYAIEVTFPEKDIRSSSYPFKR